MTDTRSRRSGLLRSASLAVLFLAGSAVTQKPVPQLPFEEALARYEQYLQRPSLYKRTLGREVLARSRDPRALEVLVKSYDRPEEPKEVVRHLIASITMDAFGKSADEEVLATWREKYDDAEDAWLWFETLQPTADRHQLEMRELVLGKEDAFLRAAALEALAARARKVGGGAELAETCLLVLDDLPSKDLDRALLLESVASVLLANRVRIRQDPWKPVAEILIRNLGEKATPHRSKVVIGRHLAKAFDSPNLGLDPHWWLNELERKPRPTNRGGETTTVPFATLRTTGYRFVYVIDASDSMLKRVTDRTRKEVGPTTGPAPKPAKGETGFVPEADDIDWTRVITRFDAAREYLRVSLSCLSEDHEFMVILFGDAATPLDTTPRLVKASLRNIRATLAELNAIEAGPPTDRRPDGQLRGKTNLHAGIATAFRHTSAGNVRQAEFVDPKAYFDGCDTVFILSDGEPSWDDYAEKDSRDPEDQAGDPESGVQYQNVPTLIFQGPYARPPYEHLVSDVHRMNLFRKAEIHCVGIGEANHHLLKRIAELGLGQAIKVESER